MPSADRPSGPGKPLIERTDAVTEQEELDEMETEIPATDADAEEAAENARHADRNAHVGGDSGDRKR